MNSAASLFKLSISTDLIAIEDIASAFRNLGHEIPREGFNDNTRTSQFSPTPTGNSVIRVEHADKNARNLPFDQPRCKRNLGMVSRSTRFQGGVNSSARHCLIGQFFFQCNVLGMIRRQFASMRCSKLVRLWPQSRRPKVRSVIIFRHTLSGFVDCHASEHSVSFRFRKMTGTGSVTFGRRDCLRDTQLPEPASGYVCSSHASSRGCADLDSRSDPSVASLPSGEWYQVLTAFSR